MQRSPLSFAIVITKRDPPEAPLQTRVARMLPLSRGGGERALLQTVLSRIWHPASQPALVAGAAKYPGLGWRVSLLHWASECTNPFIHSGFWMRSGRASDFLGEIPLGGGPHMHLEARGLFYVTIIICVDCGRLVFFFFSPKKNSENYYQRDGRSRRWRRQLTAHDTHSLCWVS